MVRRGTVWDRTTAFLGDRSAAVLAIAGPLIFLPTCLQEILRPAMSDAGTGGGAAFGLVAIVLAASGGRAPVGAVGPLGHISRVYIRHHRRGSANIRIAALVLPRSPK